MSNLDKIKKILKNKKLKPSDPVYTVILNLLKASEAKNDDIINKDVLCFAKNETKVNLLQHQQNVVNYLKDPNHRGLLLCHRTGAGKTITAISVAECFLKQHSKSNIIVVTPKSLQGNFIKEMEAWGVKEEHFDKYKFFTFDKFLTRYQIDQYGDESDDIKCSGNLIIIDEVHNLRTAIHYETDKNGENENPISGRKSHALSQCSLKAEKVLLLTATPYVNNIYDINNLMAMINGVKPLTKTQFLEQTTTVKKLENFLRCRISYFNPQNDENYPKVSEYHIKLTMSEKYYEIYYKFQQKIIGKYDNFILNPKTAFVFLTGLRQASNASPKTTQELFYSEKMEWIMDKIKHGKKNNKFVIFSFYKNFGIKMISSELEKMKIPYGEITGDIEGSERTTIVKHYNANKIKILLISSAGGEGLDLKETTDLIIMEPQWNKAKEDQIIGRAVRYKSHINLPNSQRHVNIWHLYMIKPKHKINLDKYISADEMVLNIITKKTQEMEYFSKIMETVSIENNNCK